MPVKINCHKDCRNHILLAQALARRTFFLNVADGLNSLLTLENIVDEGLPGWSKMNEEKTNFNITQHTLAYHKANKNVKQQKTIIEKGCVTCQIDLCEIVLIEEKIASIAEEAVQNFPNFLDGEEMADILDAPKDSE